MNAAMELDLGPLTWVRGEIDLSLARAAEALGRYTAAPAEADQLKFAQTHLHQAHGALSVVGLTGITQISEVLERLLADIAAEPAAADAAKLALSQEALAAIRGYLADLLDGQPHQPLRLLPLYERLGKARAQAVAASDLFFPDLSPRRAAPAMARPAAGVTLKAARGRFERGFLRWLRSADGRAGLSDMRAAVQDIELMQSTAPARAFWWATQGLLEALESGGLPIDLPLKRLFARIDTQMRRFLEGAHAVAERLTRDVLYYVAITPEGVALADEIKTAYGLRALVPQSGERVDVAPFLAQLDAIRAHLLEAKEAWNRYCSGIAVGLPQFDEHAEAIAAAAAPLPIDAIGILADALRDTAAWLRRNPLDQDDALAMEMATAMLLLDNALETATHPDPQLPGQARLMAERLSLLRQGKPLSALATPTVGEATQRAQDRQFLTQLVREIGTSLGQVEQALDAFFRDPAQREGLGALQAPLKQVEGALSVAGCEDAVELVRDCAQAIARFAQPDTVAQAGEYEALAHRLSALGFFVQALPGGNAALAPLLAPDAAAVEAPASVEDDLELQKREAEALMARLRQSPDDARLRTELKQNLETIRQEASLVADAALEREARAALAELVAAPVAAPPPPPPPAAKPAPQPAAEEIDAELLAIFLEEAHEVLGSIATQLAASRAAASDHEALTTMRRGFHTLKGSGRMVGLKEFGEAAWAVEQVMNRWLQLELDATPALHELIADAEREFAAWVVQLEGGGGAGRDVAALTAAADRLRGIDTPAVAEAPAPAAEPAAQAPAAPLAEPLEVFALEDEDGEAETFEFTDLGEVASEVADAAPAEPATAPAPEEDQVRIGELALARSLYDMYIGEARGHVATLRRELARLYLNPGLHLGEAVHRAAHTLAGISATVGLQDIHDLARALEHALLRLAHCGRLASAAESELVNGAAASLESMVDAVGAQFEPAAGDELIARLGEIAPEAEAAVVSQVMPVRLAEYDYDYDDAAADPLPPVFEAAPDAGAADEPGPLAEFAPAAPEAADDEPVATGPAFPLAADAEQSGVDAMADAALEFPIGADSFALVEEIAAGALPEPAAPLPLPELAEFEPARPDTADDMPVADLLPAEEPAAEALPAVYAPAPEQPLPDAPWGEEYAPAPRDADEVLPLAAQEAGARRDAFDTDAMPAPAAPVPESADSTALVTEIAPAPLPEPADEAPPVLAEFAAAAPAAGDTWPEPETVALAVTEPEYVVAQPAAPEFDTPAPAPAFETEAEPAAGVVPPALPAPEDRRHLRLADDLDEQLLPIFLEEAQDLMRDIGAETRNLRADPAAPEPGLALKRLLHTLKGSARMAGAMSVGELVHGLETRLESALATGSAQAGLFDDLETTLDRAAGMIEQLAVPRAAPPAEAAPAEQASVQELPAAGGEIPAGEAAEQALPAQTMLRVRADLVDRFVNEAGEMAISRSRIEGEMRSLRSSLLDLTENVIRLRHQLRELEIQAESQMQSQQAHAEALHLDFDPLEFDRFTRLQELTRMIAESVNDVTTVQHNVLRNLDGADAALSAQGRLNRDLQQALMSVRMVPFAAIAERLQRIVRQAARELGRKATLDIAGERIELDRSVLDKMAGPLEHLLRNAVAHGIEAPETRLAHGKPDIGRITLSAVREGNEVAIELADDGAGLDLERIRKRALEAGLLTADEPADEAVLTDMIFRPGFTTAAEVSQLAGRGVGMDVVRTTTTELGGRIEIASAPGQGARFRIYLPQSLAVMQAVLVSVAGKTYAVPSTMVEQAQELRAEPLARVRAARQAEWLGNAYPYHYLAHLLGDVAAQPQPARYTWLLMLRSGAQRAVIEVDALRGNEEIVVKPIGPQLSRVPGVIGATVLGDGEVVLIINPVAVSARAARPALSVMVESAPQVALQPTVMVVDDSLTVRKITGRLLERQGYRVVTAKDGVDALEQLMDELPAVMLVDIEMPRMDGFDLTRNVRADARLQGIPVIMITSRIAEKHRNYAAEIGVNHYLGKPYQEDELLALVARYARDAAPAHASEMI